MDDDTSEVYDVWETFVFFKLCNVYSVPETVDVYFAKLWVYKKDERIY